MTSQIEIVLSKNHISTLKNHAKKNEPNESCAILFGRVNDDKISATEIFLTDNASPSPVNFTISSEELIRAYQESEKRNVSVVAIFHSHPGSPAYPSLTDEKYMEINPIPWIIYSNVKDELRAYILESAIIPVTIRVL